MFKKTTFFDVYKYGYLRARGRVQGGKKSDLGWSVVIPRGPIPDIEPLTDEEEQQLINGTSNLKLNTNGTSQSQSQSSNLFSAKGEGMGAISGAEADSPDVAADTPGTGDDASVTTAIRSPGSTVGDGDEEESDPKQKIERRTTHSEENAKWYKAAKKAEKKAGAPNVHLAL